MWEQERGDVSWPLKRETVTSTILSTSGNTNWAFPGDSVVRNPPANARDMDLISDLGRFHMPKSNEACAPQLLSLSSTAWEPQLLSPRGAATEA